MNQSLDLVTIEHAFKLHLLGFDWNTDTVLQYKKRSLGYTELAVMPPIKHPTVALALKWARSKGYRAWILPADDMYRTSLYVWAPGEMDISKAFVRSGDKFSNGEENPKFRDYEEAAWAALNHILKLMEESHGS